MKNADALKRIKAMYEAVESLPDSITVCNLWIDGGGGENGNQPQITVWESSDTAPRELEAYAALIGKEPLRVVRKGDHDALLVDLENGVQLKMLVEKTEDSDENA